MSTLSYGPGEYRLAVQSEAEMGLQGGFTVSHKDLIITILFKIVSVSPETMSVSTFDI